MPGAPKPQIGRDLLEKLQAEIRFQNGGVKVCIPESKLAEALIFMLKETKTNGHGFPKEILDAVVPFVWSGEMSGKAKKCSTSTD